MKKIALLLCCILLLVGCASSSGEGGEIVYVTAENFEAEVLQSDRVVLLDFYADWCGPCKRMAPHLSEIAGEREDIKVCKIDVDEESELSIRYGIEAMPTLLVIRDGEVVQRAVGYRSKGAILALLEN